MVIGAWLFFVTKAHADERIVAPRFAPVIGTSMLPRFKAGQTVLVRPCDFRFVQVGQPIVMFEEARRINVLHDVIAIRETPNGRGLVTKGTSNADRDPHITTKENFVGCVDSP